MRSLAHAHQYILGLDVAVDNSFAVKTLKACDQLEEQHQGSFEGELAPAKFQQVAYARANHLSNDIFNILIGAVSFTEVLRNANYVLGIFEEFDIVC